MLGYLGPHQQTWWSRQTFLWSSDSPKLDSSSSPPYQIALSSRFVFRQKPNTSSGCGKPQPLGLLRQKKAWIYGNYRVPPKKVADRNKMTQAKQVSKPSFWCKCYLSQNGRLSFEGVWMLIRLLFLPLTSWSRIDLRPGLKYENWRDYKTQKQFWLGETIQTLKKFSSKIYL